MQMEHLALHQNGRYNRVATILNGSERIDQNR